jgi:flagellar FliL protein
MATKTEAPAAAKKGDAPAESAPAAAAAPAAKGGIGAMLPAILALVLAPAATWATVEFVLVPRLQKKLAAGGASAEAEAEPAPAASGHGSGHGGGKKEGGKEGKGEGAPSYEFQNVVVNLAGTMGTRYLKTSFLVVGADANIKNIFEAAKPKLVDITNNVLSSLTLADLEEPGSRNIIREKLISAYNQALGRKVAEQVYFSDFVVQ